MLHATSLENRFWGGVSKVIYCLLFVETSLEEGPDFPLPVVTP